MIEHSFVPAVRELSLNRKYILYSGAYGLTTLIVPLAVQFLVNKLALSGIWINIAIFIIIIGAGLTVSLILRYSQFVLNEYLQRELLVILLNRWEKKSNHKVYFIENFFAVKSFSKSFTGLVEIGLTTVFGLLMIITFHPGYVIFPLLVGAFLYQIHLSTLPAVQTAVAESDQKFELFQKALGSEDIKEVDIHDYLQSRNNHFVFIRRNTVKMAILFVISQVLLLGGGTYLVQSNQLSIGQLVASEIIFSGILISLNKLPATLEAVYDFECSLYKLKKAKSL